MRHGFLYLATKLQALIILLCGTNINSSQQGDPEYSFDFRIAEDELP